ncbi:MAG: c-type cytochrome [Burkholderiales bacterium]|nr:c-type cytochrome [Burkholderiales bacterium]
MTPKIAFIHRRGPWVAVLSLLALLSFVALLWLAPLPAAWAAPAYVPDARFADTLARRMESCAACHGAQGRAGPDGYYPRIAGKPAGYLYNQLLNFRDGRRHYGLMLRMVDPLSDAYLWEIAHYFAALDLPYPAPQPSTAPPALLERGRQLVQQGDSARGVPACIACHGAALTGVAPNVPGLLGLPRDYLASQLGAWKARVRSAHAPDCMAQIVERLAPEDLAAASNWLAAQPLPADTHPVAAPPQAWPMACGSAVLPDRAPPAAAGTESRR